MVVPDVDEMFMPLLDGFFVKPSEAEEVIDNLMLQVRCVIYTKSLILLDEFKMPMITLFFFPRSRKCLGEPGRLKSCSDLSFKPVQMM